MKWFKHFSHSKYDPKIMRLIQKFGLRGYGLYFAILESIAFRLTTDEPYPDLEENSQDIATFFGEDTVVIEEIMLFCMNQGLFQQDENSGRLMCLKLLTHLDNTMSNNPEIKSILSNFKKLEETSRNLKQIRLDKNRLDKNKEGAKAPTHKRFVPPTVEEVKAYCKERHNKIDPQAFIDFYEVRGWKPKGYTTQMKDWKAAVRTWEKHEQKESKRPGDLKMPEKTCPHCGYTFISTSHICPKCKEEL